MPLSALPLHAVYVTMAFSWYCPEIEWCKFHFSLSAYRIDDDRALARLLCCDKGFNNRHFSCNSIFTLRINSISIAVHSCTEKSSKSNFYSALLHLYGTMHIRTTLVHIAEHTNCIENRQVIVIVTLSSPPAVLLGFIQLQYSCLHLIRSWIAQCTAHNYPIR